MACIVRRESSGGVTYYVKYRVDGRQVMKRAGRRRKEADRLKSEIEHSLHRGTYQEVKDLTFAELADRWLELKKSTIRPKPYASYAAMVRRIVAAFGPRKVKTIRQEEVERFAAKMLDAHSGDLTKRTLTIFSAIMTKAVHWGYAGRNPVQYVEKPRSSRPEVEYLEPDEIKKLIAATGERHRCLITFACLTGCRQSEILGLRWADVDFESSRVFIRQVLQGGQFVEPKTEKSKRAVVIPPMLVEQLKVHEARQAVELDGNEHDLVFPNAAGKPMDGHNLTRRVLYPALRRAGLRRVGFHSLRHSYVSLLIAQDVNIKTIQEQVGHSSAKVTWDVYSHLFPGDKEAAVKRLQDSLFGERASRPGTREKTTPSCSSG